MTGRFPPDLFIIILVPFLTVALGVGLPPLFEAAHEHHRLAVLIAVIGSLVVALGAAGLVWRRRRSEPRR